MKNALTLIIGDKNLSSWSLRPWLVMKQSGLQFTEKQILLDRPTTKKELAKHSPSGRVPCLQHGGITVWDSLAISEYISELAPNANLWPKEAKTRAIARSYVAEMHSSFTSLRNQMSMDVQLRIKFTHMSPDTASDIRRICELWKSALTKSKGPYLFGDFSIADAFYTPVVLRFQSYGVILKDPICKKYYETILKNKFVKEWVAAAEKESLSNSLSRK